MFGELLKYYVIRPTDSWKGGFCPKLLLNNQPTWT